MPEFIPRILYSSPPGYAPAAAAIGINAFLYNDFSRKTWTQREAILKDVAKYGIKLIPWFEGVGSYDDPNIDPSKSREWNFWEGKKEFILKYKDDERIYAWNTIQEPDLGDVPVDYIKRLYTTVRTYDPGGKPCFVLWDQWDAHGYRCQVGEFDIWTMDTGASGAADVQAFKDRFRRLDGYYHWTSIGKPGIAHFYNFEALEASFRAWQEVVPAGIVGTMYYNAGIVMPNASIRAAIEAFHRSMGWWPPPEVEVTCPTCKSLLRVHG